MSTLRRKRSHCVRLIITVTYTITSYAPLTAFLLDTTPLESRRDEKMSMFIFRRSRIEVESQSNGNCNSRFSPVRYVPMSSREKFVPKLIFCSNGIIGTPVVKEIQDGCQNQISLNYVYILLNYIIKPNTSIDIPDIYMWTHKK